MRVCVHVSGSLFIACLPARYLSLSDARYHERRWHRYLRLCIDVVRRYIRRIYRMAVITAPLLSRCSTCVRTRPYRSLLHGPIGKTTRGIHTLKGQPFFLSLFLSRRLLCLPFLLFNCNQQHEQEQQEQEQQPAERACVTRALLPCCYGLNRS